MSALGDARRARLGPAALAAADAVVARKPPMTPEQRAALRVLRRPQRTPELHRTA